MADLGDALKNINRDIWLEFEGPPGECMTEMRRRGWSMQTTDFSITQDTDPESPDVLTYTFSAGILLFKNGEPATKDAWEKELMNVAAEIAVNILDGPDPTK